VCDLETSRMGAPYIYDISHLRVNLLLGSVLVQSPQYLVMYAFPKHLQNAQNHELHIRHIRLN
jgi:hypothetical protein